MDQAERASIEELITKFNQDGDRGPREIVNLVVAHGSRAVPALTDAVYTSDLAHIRGWSLIALSEILGPAGIPYLLTGLKDSQMSVRLRAIQGLVALRHADPGKDLLALLNDPSGGVRVNAIDALVKLQVRGITQQLLPLATDDKWYVRQHTARAIGELRLTDALPALHRLRSDGHPAVRKAADRALQLMNAPEV